MSNNKPAPTPQMTPDMLLSGIENQASKASYEQALGASARFVERLLQSGQLKSIDDAASALRAGVALIQPEIHKSLVALAMKELESYLPAKTPEPPLVGKA